MLLTKLRELLCQCWWEEGTVPQDMRGAIITTLYKNKGDSGDCNIVFIDLTKAFDLVSRRGLFQLLEKIGCPPKLLSMITAFHSNIKSTVLYDGAVSYAFPIKSGVKQACLLAPTLFGIVFFPVLYHAFRTSEDYIYIYTRSDGKLFNLARLKAKSKICKVFIRELLFADDAALTSHSAENLQRLVEGLLMPAKKLT